MIFYLPAKLYGEHIHFTVSLYFMYTSLAPLLARMAQTILRIALRYGMLNKIMAIQVMTGIVMQG